VGRSGESRGSRNSIGSGPRYEAWAPLGAQTSSPNSLTQLARQLAQSRIHPPKGPQVREGGRTHAVRFLQPTLGLSKSHRGSSQATFPRAQGRRVLKAWPRDCRLLVTCGPAALRPGITTEAAKRPPAVHQGEAGPSYAASEIGVPMIPNIDFRSAWNTGRVPRPPRCILNNNLILPLGTAYLSGFGKPG